MHQRPSAGLDFSDLSSTVLDFTVLDFTGQSPFAPYNVSALYPL